MYKDYQTKKEKGLIEIVKIGGGYAYSSKQFDQTTGEQIMPEVAALDIDRINKERTELLKNIADIDAILGDIKAMG